MTDNQIELINDAFCALIKSGRSDIEQYFDLVNLDYENNRPIKAAAAYNNLVALKILLSRPEVDPSTTNQYPIFIATEKNNIECVAELLKHPKVDPTTDEHAVYRLAAIRRYTTILDLLVQHPSFNAYNAYVDCKKHKSDCLWLFYRFPTLEKFANSTDKFDLL
jgi:hypothetical protein